MRNFKEFRPTITKRMLVNTNMNLDPEARMNVADLTASMATKFIRFWIEKELVKNMNEIMTKLIERVEDGTLEYDEEVAIWREIRIQYSEFEAA